MFKTPILLIIFNRPETEKKVFEAIRRIKPRQLFIAADGPRKNRFGDKEKCEEARRITENIDWPCKVQRLYRKDNIGCGKNPAEAITWFFNNVDSGIILEDDCVPNDTFFKFCSNLLEKYKDDKRIMMISGDNFQDGYKRNNDSYYFSRHFHCWGWASWRRAWDKFDYKINSWPTFKKEKRINALFNGDKIVSSYWENIFDFVYKNNTDIWDYQWTFTCLSNNGLCILPNTNLVKNVGIGDGATHTTRKNSRNTVETNQINFPLKHPEFVIKDTILDKRTDYNHFITLRSALGLIFYKIFKGQNENSR